LFAHWAFETVFALDAGFSSWSHWALVARWTGLALVADGVSVYLYWDWDVDDFVVVMSVGVDLYWSAVVVVGGSKVVSVCCCWSVVVVVIVVVVVV